MPLHDDDDLSNVINPKELKKMLKLAFNAGEYLGIAEVCAGEGMNYKKPLYSSFEEWYRQTHKK